MMRKLLHGQTRKHVSLIEEKQRELQGETFRDGIVGSQQLRPYSLDHRLGSHLPMPRHQESAPLRHYTREK